MYINTLYFAMYLFSPACSSFHRLYILLLSFLFALLLLSFLSNAVNLAHCPYFASPERRCEGTKNSGMITREKKADILLFACRHRRQSEAEAGLVLLFFSGMPPCGCAWSGNLPSLR